MQQYRWERERQQPLQQWRGRSCHWAPLLNTINYDRCRWSTLEQIKRVNEFIITVFVGVPMLSPWAPSDLTLTFVGSDHCFLQFGDDVLLHTRELKHTVVPRPVFRCDWWKLQVNTHLEGSIVVGEDLSVVHLLMKLLSIFPPDEWGSVRVETCSEAADWRGGSLLEERHRGKLWREINETISSLKHRQQTYLTFANWL